MKFEVKHVEFIFDNSIPINRRQFDEKLEFYASNITLERRVSKKQTEITLQNNISLNTMNNILDSITNNSLISIRKMNYDFEDSKLMVFVNFKR